MATDADRAVAVEIIASASLVVVAGAIERSPVDWRSDLRAVVLEMMANAGVEWTMFEATVADAVGCDIREVLRASNGVHWELPALNPNDVVLEVQLFAGRQGALSDDLLLDAASAATMRMLDATMHGIYAFRRDVVDVRESMERVCNLLGVVVHAARNVHDAVDSAVEDWVATRILERSVLELPSDPLLELWTRSRRWGIAGSDVG